MFDSLRPRGPLPGSSVHGFFQARVLEWVAVSFSRGSYRPRDQTREKGIPYLYLSDASQGVNMRHNLPDPDMVKQLEKSTAFPSTIMLSATFNKDLAYRYAEAVGEECRAGGI